MNPKLQLFVGIMVFYVVLSHLAFPAAFYFFVEKSLSSAGNGFAVGSLVSVALWFGFGRKMVK